MFQISKNTDLRKSGYVGEYFIRPPADITLTFKAPVDISHIKLSAKVEQKCSTGFSIFTQPENGCQNRDPSSSIDSSSGNVSRGVPGNNERTIPPVTDHSASTQESFNVSENDDVYFCVGTFFTGGEDIVYLKNYHYKQWIKMKIPDVSVAESGSKVYRGSLKHSNRLALRGVKKMMIRISRTLGTGPPVLRSLEVWGQLGIDTDKILRREMLSNWRKRILSVEASPPIPRMYNSAAEDAKDMVAPESTSKPEG